MQTSLPTALAAMVLTSAASAQVGQFDTIYQDEALAVEARYTLSLGAERVGRFSLSLIDQDWNGVRRGFTVMSYDRQGVAAFGITAADIDALNEDGDEDADGGAARNTAVIVGVLGLGVIGGAVLLSEVGDDLTDAINCAIDDVNCE